MSGVGMMPGRLDIPPFRFYGLGLSFAWGLLLWQGPAGSISGAASSACDPVWILSSVISPLAALLLVFYGRTAELPCRKVVALSAALAASCGTALAAVSSIVSNVTVQLVCIVLSGILTAVAPAILTTLWAVVLVKLSMKAAETVIPASFLMTFLCCLVVPYLPYAAYVLALCCLPLFCGLCLCASIRALDEGRMSRSQLAASDGGSHIRNSRLDGNKALRICIVLLMVTAVSSFFGFMWPEGFSDTFGRASLSSLVAPVIASLATVAITIFSKPVDFDSFFHWLYVPTLVAVALYGIGPRMIQGIAVIALLCVFMMSSVIMLLYAIRLARQTHYKVTFLFAAALLFSNVGCLIGGIAEQGFSTAIADGGFTVQTACYLLIIFFSCSILVLDRNKDDGKSAIEVEEVGSPSKVAGEGPSTEKVDREKWINDRCGEISREYGLTRRESEIMAYLVRGRSQPYIRDALYLSQNTVASHTRNIYRKLDIHSKQGLLDILEEPDGKSIG